MRSPSDWQCFAKKEIKVALDDFGTGYASLSYLGSLPLDALKIDRGLVAKIGTSERDRIVVRSIFTLARDLGLHVIVEGVESTTQLVLLAEWGCDLYQGFLGAGALTRPSWPASSQCPRPTRPRPPTSSFVRSPAAATRASPRRNLQRAVEPRLGRRPVAATDQLAVRPELGRALQPLDIAEQAGEVGEAAFREGDQSAFRPDVELGDHRLLRR